MSVAELLVQVTATLSTVIVPTEFAFGNGRKGETLYSRDEALAEARAIVAAIYGEPCSRPYPVRQTGNSTAECFCGWPLSMHREVA